jgi:hypothetical protein
MVGSTLFALGAVPWYADAVGPLWDSLTFFVGSIFFTSAGFIQLLLSGRRPPLRGASAASACDWLAAAIQFVGTLLFNVSTFAVVLVAYRGSENPAAGWVPDAWGSAAFLISSGLALVAAGRRHELWDPDARTWRGTWLNMAGSVAFGISAVGAHVLPATGEPVDVRWVNLGTFLGAVCFFVAAALSRRNIEPGTGVRP